MSVAGLLPLRRDKKEKEKEMKFRSIQFLLIGCLMVISQNSYSSTILTFDNPPVAFQDGYGDGDTYVEDDYSLSSISDPGHSGAFIRLNPDTQAALVPNNGTVHVGTSLFSNPWLRRTDGGAFSLLSLDVAEYSEFVTWPTSVSLTGLKGNGDTLQANLSLDGIFDGSGGVDDFQHYVLNWEDLVRVNFNTDGIAFDNIEVASVPVPAAIWLFISGLVFIRVFGRVSPR